MDVGSISPAGSEVPYRFPFGRLHAVLSENDRFRRCLGVSRSQHCVEVPREPDGHYLYASNRGCGSKVVFPTNLEWSARDYSENAFRRGLDVQNFDFGPPGIASWSPVKTPTAYGIIRVNPATGRLSPQEPQLRYQVHFPRDFSYLISSRIHFCRNLTMKTFSF